MKVKVRITETLERVIEVEDANSVEEALEKVRSGYQSGDIVLAADDASDVEFCAPTDEENICPVCGGELEFGEKEQMDDGGVYNWECTQCGATGQQGYDEVFDGHHYNVRDADGKPIPEREEPV